MNIRQKLAELRALAREGAPVDAAEYVELEARARAEEQLAELAADGERTRAQARAEREAEARRAQAATDARDRMATALDAIKAADQVVIDALAHFASVSRDYRDAIDTTAHELSAAGYLEWNQSAMQPRQIDHPRYDGNLLPVRGDHGWSVEIDGIRHQHIDPGHAVVYAALTNPDAQPWVAKWRRSRDTYPVLPAIPGSDLDTPGYY